MRYAELDDVVYRATDDDDPIAMYNQKLVGGRWVPNGHMIRVAHDGMPITEARARELAGDDWPEGEGDFS